jgi:hypothetical protein
LSTEHACEDAKDIPDDFRRELPRWWSLSLQLQVVLPSADRRQR